MYVLKEPPLLVFSECVSPGLTCCISMLEYLSAPLLLYHLQPCCRLSGERGFSAYYKSRLQILQQILLLCRIPGTHCCILVSFFLNKSKNNCCFWTPDGALQTSCCHASQGQGTIWHPRPGLWNPLGLAPGWDGEDLIGLSLMVIDIITQNRAPPWGS